MADRPKFDRKAAKEQLAKRTEESYQSKDQGMSFNRYFDREANLPFWMPKRDVEGGHMIDIIPYPAGPDDPGVIRGLYPEGDTVYHLDIWIHQRIGPRDLQVVCPEQNHNKPCAICEFRNRIRKEGADDDDTKVLLPKRRSSYNVIVCDEGAEEDKGIQVLEVSHYYMEQKLMAAARKKRGGGGYVSFSDPDEGKSVKFEIHKKGDFDDWDGHGFEDRDYTIDDETLGETFILDSYVVTHTPEEIEAIVKEMEEGGVLTMSGTDSGGEEEAEEKTGGRRRSRRERAVKEDGAEPEKPPRGTRRSMQRMEEPVTPEGDPECPEGGVFGKDTDEFVGCDNCDIYNDCLAAKEEKEPPKRTRGQRRQRAPDGDTEADTPEEPAAEPEPEKTTGKRRGRRSPRK